MKLRHLLMLGMFITPATAAADSWRGKVVDVLDGDTLVVLQRGRRVEVCLHGVDAPEKDQPFGAKARSFASQLVIGKLVTIKDTGKQRGCQIVAQVYLGSMHRPLIAPIPAPTSNSGWSTGGDDPVQPGEILMYTDIEIPRLLE